MSVLPTPDKPSARKRGIAVKILAAMGLLLLIGIVAGLIAINTLFPASASDVAALENQFRQAGIPLTVAELKAMYEPVPDDENGAIAYQDAMDLFESKGEKEFARVEELYDEFVDKFPVVDDETWAAVSAYCADHSDVVEALLKAGYFSHAHYGLNVEDRFEMEMPHLSKLRNCSRLLALASDDAVRRGDGDTAARLIVAQLDIARSLESEPLLVSQLFRVAINSNASGSLERVITQAELTSDTICMLQDHFREADKEELLRFGMSAEVAMSYSVIVDFYAGKRIVGEKSGAEGIGKFPPLIRETVGYNDQMKFLESSGFLLLKESASLLELQEAIEETEFEKSKFHMMSSFFVPNYPRAVSAFMRDLAGLRNAQTALAIERYRAEHDGDIPDSLNALVPDYLDEVPIDPFDNKPLRFKARDTGYVVYSISHNKQDDNGAPYERDEDGGIQGDWPFVVTR